MPEFYLGVDGGQSSTTMLIADYAGVVVGHAVAGPCNHVSGSEAEAKFRGVIGSCLAAACAEAGLDPATAIFKAACLGFSGGPADKDRWVRHLIRSPLIKTTDDGDIALAGALGGEPGIIVVSGTGSIASGRNRDGKTARTGGWGYRFGDEGSAFDLVKRALRVALQAEEGWGSPSVLRDRLLQVTGIASANELMHAFYTEAWPRARIASLAPVVTAAADDDDDCAKRLLHESAVALCGYVAGVYRQLFESPVPVATVGGTWKADAWRNVFAKVLHQAIGCNVVDPLFTSAEGALLLARQLVSYKDWPG